MEQTTQPIKKNHEASEQPEPEMLEFTVMPTEGAGQSLRKPNLIETSSKKNKWWLWAVAAVIVIAIGVLVYFFFQKTPSDDNVPGPAVQLPGGIENFESSQLVDADNDGLTDKLESDAATNPSNPDTDGDGLADGDEVFIYKSDPLLMDTDNDSFDDGREVARGYSPLENSTEKVSADVLTAWQDSIQKFGLHEPTPTTLSLKKEVDLESFATYTNNVFQFSLDLPSVLTFREALGGQPVGFYIAGTNPSDEDFSTDPIHLDIAAKAGNESLRDWVMTQFPAADVNTISELTVNSISALHFSIPSSDSCGQEKVVYPRDGTVTILTLNCFNNVLLAQLFSKIYPTFRYLQ